MLCQVTHEMVLGMTKRNVKNTSYKGIASENTFYRRFVLQQRVCVAMGKPYSRFEAIFDLNFLLKHVGACPRF